MKNLLPFVIAALGVIMLGFELQIIKLQQRVKQLEGGKK